MDLVPTILRGGLTKVLRIVVTFLMLGGLLESMLFGVLNMGQNLMYLIGVIK